MFIIGMSLLYAYVMSSLNISQSAAAWIVSLHASQMGACGCDSADRSRARLLLAAGLDHSSDCAGHPATAGVGEDLIWFGVVMTIVIASWG